MSKHLLDTIIPAAYQVEKFSDSLPVKSLQSFYIAPGLEFLAPAMAQLLDFFRLDLRPAAAAQADWSVTLDKTLNDPEAFKLEITPEKLIIQTGGARGGRYALQCCKQLLANAFIAGVPSAKLDCGKIFDRPRFGYRGLHLDCARHFQRPGTVKKVLDLMSECRLNTLHWHLVDSQGWRLPLKATAGLEKVYMLDEGFYTREEIREITEYANKLGIGIIPEVDFPGHSKIFLEFFPQFHCPNADGVIREVCIGNPEVKSFLQGIYKELAELFPASSCIHIGGDEANTRNWEKCPCCQKAMQSKNCRNMRELENSFMTEMSQYIVSLGKTPIVWGTCSGQRFPENTVMQAWNNIREPLEMVANGNKYIYSVHNSLYLDYPDNLSEPADSWMFKLDSEAIYLTDPYITWPEKVANHTLGVEACLWTETVPEWRIMSKLLPRLIAYSEVAWSEPEHKNYDDFQSRQKRLTAAGIL